MLDRDAFKAGKDLTGQMDEVQDRCDLSLLVLSPHYLKSAACCHEMNRAVARDPCFAEGFVIPVLRHRCALPTLFEKHTPLYVDLCDDADTRAWDRVLDACCCSLGSTAPAWLAALETSRKTLARGRSVNLVAGPSTAWREIVRQLREDGLSDMGIVDLESGSTASRRGLIREILRATGSPGDVPPEPEDLVVMEQCIVERPGVTRLALLHFDLAAMRSGYGLDLFTALRHLIEEKRKLVLLIQSRESFARLLPPDHPLSPLTVIEPVLLLPRS